MCVFVIIWALLSHGATSQCTEPLFFYFFLFFMTAALRSTFVHQRCCTLRRDDLHWFSEGATCKQTTLGPFLNASFFFDVRTVLWSRVQMVVMWTMKEIQTITSQLWGERSSLSQSRVYFITCKNIDEKKISNEFTSQLLLLIVIVWVMHKNMTVIIVILLFSVNCSVDQKHHMPNHLELCILHWLANRSSEHLHRLSHPILIECLSSSAKRPTINLRTARYHSRNSE